MLDIDRDRQRISLGLKQTQEDPWQRVVDTYHVGDELEGTVTKVVAFGAFVEILEGVEGLVHISELAQQHVENPREIVPPGDEVKVKILEIDSERRRLSLSIKRVEGQVLPRRDRGSDRATRATSRTCRSWACPRTSSPRRRPVAEADATPTPRATPRPRRRARGRRGRGGRRRGRGRRGRGRGRAEPEARRAGGRGATEADAEAAADEPAAERARPKSE